MNQDDFVTARECLKASSVVLSEVSDSDEKLAESKADQNRCWIKYLLGLLEHSQQGLIFKDFEAQMGLGDGQGKWLV